MASPPLPTSLHARLQATSSLPRLWWMPFWWDSLEPGEGRNINVLSSATSLPYSAHCVLPPWLWTCYLVWHKDPLPLDLRDSAAAAKSLQSCPTLCDPIDGSPPGPAVPGIFQARVLEWGAIAFSQETLVWCNLVLMLPCIVSLLNMPLSQLRKFSPIFSLVLWILAQKALWRGIPSLTSLTAF